MSRIPENSKPISDSDNRREKRLIPCAGCEQALAKCPVLLLRCADAETLSDQVLPLLTCFSCFNFSGSGYRHFTFAAEERRNCLAHIMSLQYIRIIILTSPFSHPVDWQIICENCSKREKVTFIPYFNSSARRSSLCTD